MSFKAFITKTTAHARSGVSKVSNTVKLYSRKNAIIEELNDLFDTLGKMSYYNAIGEGSETAEDDIVTVISEITRLKNELVDIEEELRIKSGKKQCPECHGELQRNALYCPYCGAKLTDDPVAETSEEQQVTEEVIEDVANTEE